MVSINFQAQIMNQYANRYDPTEMTIKRKKKKADWIHCL